MIAIFSIARHKKKKNLFRARLFFVNVIHCSCAFVGRKKNPTCTCWVRLFSDKRRMKGFCNMSGAVIAAMHHNIII